MLLRDHLLDAFFLCLARQREPDQCARSVELFAMLGLMFVVLVCAA